MALAESSAKRELGAEENPFSKKRKLGDGVWANLDLILSIQNKQLPLQRKIELAFDFISKDPKIINGTPNSVSISRFVLVLSDWIHSVLISDQNKISSDFSDPCLDFRCWAILRFCVDSSLVGVSPNLLRAVTRFARHALNDNTGYSVQLIDQASECLSVILASDSRVFHNAGVELWVSCAMEIVSLLRRIVSDDNQGACSAVALSKMSRLVVEHFSNFLRFHPNPKNVFRIFVDRLLEPLLEFLVLLHVKVDTGKSEDVGSLVKMVEEVLSNGLFHPAHIGGFSSLRGLSVQQEVRESKGINESYHRHFFRRLEKIIAEKKAMALGGLGYLLRMFVSRVKAQKLASLSFKHEEALRKGAEASEEAHATSKPLFELFVQFMEPLLVECKRFADTDLSGLRAVLKIQLVEVHGMLRSVNETLASFIQERIYVRCEDTSEGTHCSFLTEVCGNIVSIADRILVIWLSDGGVQKILALIAKEVLVALGYLLEIEYKAVGDDLAILWLVLLSFSALSVTITDKKPFALINAEISKLGCQVINVYSELRQVHIPIFALCKAIRFLTASDVVGIVEHAKRVYASTLSSDIRSESVTSLLWSHEVQLVVSNAVKSIPEGQASGCILHLTVDFTASLEWMRLGSVGANAEELGEAGNLKINSPELDLQAELLGRFLSEIYTILLDSLTVTATNCVFIGNSMKNLMKNIRPSFRYLVQDHPDGVDEFCFSVTGCKLTKYITTERDSHLWINPKCMTWILVFYFRIYVSCRSLYRQSISLMPPDSSQKASVAMGSSFIMACGVDWKEMSDCMDEGYFSWIVKSSISLVDVINSLSEHFLSSNPGRFAPLVYVFHIMALQRLVDLNRHIKSYEFFHERDARLIQMKSDTHMQKMCKKWKRLLKVSRKEAAELTNFMIGYMPPCVSRGWLVNKDGTGEVNDMFFVYEAEWDLGACSLFEKSLPVAIWWLLCQNVDVWCTHATKKALKQFCSRLLHYSLPCRSSSTIRYNDKLAKYQLLQQRKVTVHLISLEFLSNTVSYEQKVLLKLFPARFCFVLKNTILPLLSSDLASNADLCSAAEWSEVMNVLDKKPVVFIDNGDAVHDLSSPPPSDTVFLKICGSKHKRESVSSLDMALEASESLLKLLGRMLRVYFDAKSFIIYTTCILNLEKHLVSKLSSYHGDSSRYVSFEILRLFISCRKTLKCLLMASIEDPEVRQSLSSSVLFSNSLSMSWALKSVYQVVGLPCVFFEQKYATQVGELILSLMDHTSYVFFAVSSGQTTAAMPFLLDDKESETESMMNHISEILSEQLVDILFILKSDKLALRKEAGISVLNWNAISSVISCSQGFLWGFTSAIDNMYKDCSSENLQPSSSIRLLVSKLISFMGVFEDFINLCLNILLTDHGQENKILYNKCDFSDLVGEDGPSSSNVLNMDFSMGGIVTEKCGGKDDNDTEQALESECSKTSTVKKRKPSSSHANYAGTVLHGFQKFDLSKAQHPKEALLQSLLRGENPQIAFVLKQIFVSCAAILQLKCLSWFHRATESQISCSSSELSSTYILLLTSRVVLHEMAKMSERPEPYTFFWLSGILNYLEVLGSYFNFTNPDLSKNLYAELIDIHLKAIGKCISLQGKAATLSSHETNSNIKMLKMQGGGLSELEMLVPDHREYSVNAFKVRLRKSFQMLIKRPLRLHLLTAVKALERALVGVHKSSNMIYEINTGSLGGGMVSSYVAAGVDCLDLVLEIVPGTKPVIRRNISSLVSALFNIVLHLQSSSIFFLEKRPLNEIELNPHPGMVILMCVGVLTKVVGGHSYKMSPHHISQCLHLPTALFHKFRRLNASSVECHNWAFSTNQDARQLKVKQCHSVDNQFSVDLYAACCRLLSTTLRHHKCEAGRCVGLIEDSVSILLSSLEMVDLNFAWGLQEAVKCASFFRRIYEEIRHQKDIFARHAAHFLSSYITTYSGHGPLKLGIRKEVDEALRPGVYALIDICTPTDLQRLHTVLGEGPCRSTLANLQHDYRLNFQYEGKI